jgi:hypothetical protein
VGGSDFDVLGAESELIIRTILKLNDKKWVLDLAKCQGTFSLLLL